jgi:hypothetical protein
MPAGKSRGSPPKGKMFVIPSRHFLFILCFLCYNYLSGLGRDFLIPCKRKILWAPSPLFLFKFYVIIIIAGWEEKEPLARRGQEFFQTPAGIFYFII